MIHDFTLEQLIKCVSREIGLRETVYPRRVADGKMKQSAADREVEMMKAVREHLERLAAQKELPL